MDQIKKIVIVGGGSSGWMTAILLNRFLPNVEITLVESSDIPIIGVGESTNVMMWHFQKLAGLQDEQGLMRASNGAFKVAIRFKNFNRQGGVYYHTFGQPFEENVENFKGEVEKFYPSYHLSETHTGFSKNCDYAYQIDAGLYGQYLKVECKKRGVKQIVDNVTRVVLSPERSDHIERIETEKSGSIKADLFVDCTGFRSFLLGQALKEPFQSVNKYLLNDRAIAARIPYADKQKDLKVYTNCVGLSSGWVWEIPLWSRMGTGYVYSSAYLSKDEAEAEYRRYLGEDRVKDVSFNHINIRAGRSERAWVGNCVGIGISSGFLEPLESTGLSLTQVSIIDLALALSRGKSLRIERELYNKRTAEIFDTTRDFVAAHFVLTQRDDTPYWKYIRNENPMPDSLVEVLTQARSKRYTLIQNLANTFYREANWNIILSGMEFFQEKFREFPTPVLPETKNHATYLAEKVYNNSYTEPLYKSDDMALHPVWYPTAFQR